MITGVTASMQILMISMDLYGRLQEVLRGITGKRD